MSHDYLADKSGDASLNLGRATQWGLAALVLGCTMILGGIVTMVFNASLWVMGPRGINLSLAWVGALLGLVAAVAVSAACVVFGILGWRTAFVNRQPLGLSIAGTLAGAGALVSWAIAAGTLIAILDTFTR